MSIARQTLFIKLSTKSLVDFVTLTQGITQLLGLSAVRTAVLRYQLVNVIVQSSQDCLTLCATNCLKLNSSHSAVCIVCQTLCGLLLLMWRL